VLDKTIAANRQERKAADLNTGSRVAFLKVVRLFNWNNERDRSEKQGWFSVQETTHLYVTYIYWCELL